MATYLTSVILLLFSFSIPVPSLSRPSPSVQTELLTVPNDFFDATVKEAMEQLRQTLSLISQFNGMSGDSRVSKAINDCSELLDISDDQLSWSLALTDPVESHGIRNGTGNRGSDLASWLSAALSNQDACLDGFDGTDGTVKALLAGNIQVIDSLISNILKMVRNIPTTDKSFPGIGANDFPPWIGRGARRLLQAPIDTMTPNVTVALDGSGNYTTIMEAVDAAPNYSVGRYIIYVKKGVYREYVDIKKKKWNLMMIGDGIGATVVTGNRNFVDGWTTFRSATFAVSAKGFIARSMTFENTAGPSKHQAVALRSGSDLSVFYRCGIHGYQDTLYCHSLRQFYRECEITGTVDFIFGNGAVVLQNCAVIALTPLPSQKNTITAQGRKEPDQTTGFSLQYCNISASLNLPSSINSTSTPTPTQTYLGRPWKQYSRTVVMQSYISSSIRPEGWLPWQGDFALNTLFYGEYLNYGPGSNLSSRVTWPGFHVFNDSTQANSFTVAQFIEGNMWLPPTGVKYISGLNL